MKYSHAHLLLSPTRTLDDIKKLYRCELYVLMALLHITVD